MPFRAETARGYVEGVAQAYAAEEAARQPLATVAGFPARIEMRFRYNQAFRSVYAILPGIIMLMLVLIPAMMTALGVVREKETGAIANFRATPVTRLEFLLGKQAPYVAIAAVSFLSLLLMALLLFGVPVQGSVAVLFAGSLLYVLATTAFGLLVSSFTRTQIAAIFATAILVIIPSVNFSGLLVPVSSLSGGSRLLGLAFPAAWYQQVSVGTFAKALGLPDLWPELLMLAGFGVLFILLAALALSKQET
jgi:ribosome-dependent ATPase